MNKLFLLCGLAVWTVTVVLLGTFYLHTREPTGWTCESMAYGFRTTAMQKKWLQLRCDDKLTVGVNETNTLVSSRAGQERAHRQTKRSGDGTGDREPGRPIVAVVVAAEGDARIPTAGSALAQQRNKRLHDAANATAVLAGLPLAALLRSFASTAEAGFEYWVYVVYNAGDGVFDRDGGGVVTSGALDGWWNDHAAEALQERGVDATLVPVRFRNRLNRVGAADNFGIACAYADGADYLFSVRDTTVLLTPWAGALVSALQSLTPPLLGLVRPRSAAADDDNWSEVLVHRTHMDIFGSFVPPAIAGW